MNLVVIIVGSMNFLNQIVLLFYQIIPLHLLLILIQAKSNFLILIDKNVYWCLIKVVIRPGALLYPYCIGILLRYDLVKFICFWFSYKIILNDINLGYYGTILISINNKIFDRNGQFIRHFDNDLQCPRTIYID